jgi:hypothetical protein
MTQRVPSLFLNAHQAVSIELRGEPEDDVGLANLKALREGRRAPRFPTNIRAEIGVGAHRRIVTITDISAVGAMTSGADLPARGEQVVLYARQFEVSAIVIWSRDQCCGLNFRRRIESLDVVRKNAPELAMLGRRLAAVRSDNAR